MPSRARCSAAAVDDQLSVDGVADAPLEGTHRFLAAVTLSLLAQVVATTGGVVTDLGDRDHVDGVVELAVATRVEPVPDYRSAGGLDGGGGVVAGVVPGAGEPPDVTAVADQVGGDDRPDSIQADHRGPGRFNGVAGALKVLGELAIDTADFGQEIASERLAFDVDRCGRTDSGQDLGRLFGS